MVEKFGNSVIKQCCKKVGGVTLYLNMAVFDILESILLQVGVTWKGLQTLVRPS